MRQTPARTVGPVPPERKFVPAALSILDAEGTVEGYASLFGVEDMARDVVERGAFAASLARRGAGGVKLLWQHDPAEPIGRWLSLVEDGRGLKVRGRLALDTRRGREALSLVADGVVDGLSIGFRTVRAAPDPKARRRRLLEVDLWEISIVTFPMLPAARITAVASGGAAAPKLTETIRRATALLMSE